MTKKEFLRECIEYRIQKNELTMWIIMLVFIEMLIIPFSLMNGEEEYIAVAIIFLVCLMPVIIYFIVKIVNIKKHFKDYVFYEVTLDEVNNSFFRSRVYFTVTIIHDQKEYKIDTKSLFSTAILDFIYYPLDEYMNKKMLVAFNPKLEEVVLVKKV